MDEEDRRSSILVARPAEGPGSVWRSPVAVGGFLPYRRFAGYAAIAVAIGLAPWVFWQLSDVILFGFGAILIAILLNLVAEPLRRWTPIPSWACLILAALVVLAVFAGTAWIFGSHVSLEFSDVANRVQVALKTIQGMLRSSAVGQYLLRQAQQGTHVSITQVFQQILSLGTEAFEALIIIVICAAYVVAQPASYRRGLVMLFPPRMHGGVESTLDEIGATLRLWLIGQLTQMAIIGALSTLAVWLLGLPPIFALGLIAAAAEFVPYLGPIIASIPAILVALTQSPMTAVWTIVAYLLIHQIEGNVVTPLIQRHFVVIPPAMMLIGVAAIGTLFGFVGLLFAGPVVAVLYAATRKVYVQGTLGETLEPAR